MTIPCPYCHTENRIAGYYTLSPSVSSIEALEATRTPILCVGCGRELKPESQDPETVRMGTMRHAKP